MCWVSPIERDSESAERFLLCAPTHLGSIQVLSFLQQTICRSVCGSINLLLAPSYILSRSDSRAGTDPSMQREPRRKTPGDTIMQDFTKKSTFFFWQWQRLKVKIKFILK